MSADPGSFAYFSGGRAFGWFGGSTLGFDHFAGGRYVSPVYGSASAVAASGSLAVAPVAASGSGAVAIDAAGSTAIGPIAAGGGSALPPVDAAGAVAIDPVAALGSWSLPPVSATGSLAIESIAGVGGFLPPVEATGSLAIGPIAVAGSASYDGPNVLAALQRWWGGRPDLQALTSDGRLWHLEAPEGVDPPYLTYFTVAETERGGRTTAYAYVETLVQFSAHARTDADAAALRKAVRGAVKGARLTIDSAPVWYALPGGQTLAVGEGFGPHGSDCWVATVDVSIPWQADAG